MPKINGYTKERGYCWKFCPYSTNYANKYYLAIDPITGSGYRGQTTNPDITQLNFNSVVTSDHPYTNGTMNYKNNGGTPGFICLDDACQFFIDNGVRHFEH